MTRVAVVGCGAVGVTAAADLAARGADVVAYERDAVGSGATERAAGLVYHAHAGDVDAATTRRAVERFRARSGTGGFRFHETAYCWFATEPGPAAEAVDEQVDGMRRQGCDAALVDPDELRARFPQLRTGDLTRAAVAETAGVADPAAYATATAERARDAGATLREGVAASVETDPLSVVADGERREFDAVLVAAGPETRPILAEAGIAVPLEPYRAQAVRTDGPAVPAFYDATARYYAAPTQRGLVAGDGAAAASLGDWDPAADPDVVEWLTDRLEDRLVNYAATVDGSWAGLCTATPDRDPLLGEVADGLYVAAGWHGSGFMRAPATGEAIAAQVLGEEGIPAFDPGRFDGDEAVPPPGAHRP